MSLFQALAEAGIESGIEYAAEKAGARQELAKVLQDSGVAAFHAECCLRKDAVHEGDSVVVALALQVSLVDGSVTDVETGLLDGLLSFEDWYDWHKAVSFLRAHPIALKEIVPHLPEMLRRNAFVAMCVIAFCDLRLSRAEREAVRSSGRQLELAPELRLTLAQNAYKVVRQLYARAGRVLPESVQWLLDRKDD